MDEDSLSKLDDNGVFTIVKVEYIEKNMEITIYRN